MIRILFKSITAISYLLRECQTDTYVLMITFFKRGFYFTLLEIFVRAFVLWMFCLIGDMIFMDGYLVKTWHYVVSVTGYSYGYYLSKTFLNQWLFSNPKRQHCHHVGHSRSSHSEVFCWKGVLKICRKFTGENPSRSTISIKLLCSFIKITFRHECSPVNLLHIFRTPFPKNTFEWLLLSIVLLSVWSHSSMSKWKFGLFSWK